MRDGPRARIKVAKPVKPIGDGLAQRMHSVPAPDLADAKRTTRRAREAADTLMREMDTFLKRSSGKPR